MMQQVYTLLKINEEFISIDDFYDSLPDTLYIEGAIICRIQQRQILTLEHWDLVDQLWAYIIDALIKVSKGEVAETYFPDQPLLLRFEPEGDSKLHVAVGDSSHTVDRVTFISAMKVASIDFLLRMKVLVPEQSDSWDLYLEKTNLL